MKIQNLKPTNKNQNIAIQEELDKFSIDINSILKKSDSNLRVVLLEDKSKQNIRLINNQILEILAKFKIQREICSAGLFFGFIRKIRFYLSLEGAEFLLKKSMIPKTNLIFLNNNGEKSVLYGNHILKNMVLEIPPNLKKNTLLIILNKNKEIVGLALSIVDFSEFSTLKPNALIANTLTDKGYYLRRKQ